jgi:hypothetical protein
MKNSRLVNTIRYYIASLVDWSIFWPSLVMSLLGGTLIFVDVYAALILPGVLLAIASVLVATYGLWHFIFEVCEERMPWRGTALMLLPGIAAWAIILATATRGA